MLLFAVVVAACLISVAAVWLGTARPARAPSSGFAPEAFLDPVMPGSALCVPREAVPAGATGVQLTLGSSGRTAGTSVEVTGTRAGRMIFLGGRRFPEGQDFFIPFKRPVASEQVVTFCVKNTGRYPLRVGGKPGLGPSIRYPEATTVTWAQASGKIADRFRYVRFAPFGAVTVWVFLALGFGAVVTGVTTLILVTRP